MDQRGAIKRSADGEPVDTPAAKRPRTGDAPTVVVPPLFDGYFGSVRSKMPPALLRAVHALLWRAFKFSHAPRAPTCRD